MKYLFNGITGDFDLVAGQEENCLLALSANQGNINAGTVINLIDNITGVTVNNNIVFNNSTHRATLKSGKTYKLQSFLRLWGNVNAQSITYGWWDVTNSVWLGKIGHLASLDFPAGDSFQQVSNAIVTPSTNIEVELRCESVSSANQGVMGDYSQAVIEKISETEINVVTVGAVDEKLKRVDNDLFETAQDNVEYYSPTQQGRRYGIVYRKYFTIPDILVAGDSKTIAIGATPVHFLSYGGYVNKHASNIKLPIGVGAGHNSSELSIGVWVDGSDLLIDANVGLDWSGGYVWIDYSK